MGPVATSLDTAVLAKTLNILIYFASIFSINYSTSYQAEVEF